MHHVDLTILIQCPTGRRLVPRQHKLATKLLVGIQGTSMSGK
jgi:hypothetical protein